MNLPWRSCSTGSLLQTKFLKQRNMNWSKITLTSSKRKTGIQAISSKLSTHFSVIKSPLVTAGIACW